MTQPNALGRVLRYFTDAVGYAKAQPRSRFGPYLATLAASLPDWSEEAVDEEAARTLAACCPWVYSDIKVIADRIAAKSAKPQVKRRAGDELEDLGNHPFEELWASPNSLMPGSFLIRSVMWWLLLSGNGYIFIGTPSPGRGEPQELWTLPANIVEPLPKSQRKSALSGGPIVDYQITIQSQRHVWPGENMIHFRFPNPFDIWEGLSPLTAAITGVRLDFNQAKWTREFFGKGNAIPTAIISVPSDIDEDEFRIAKELFQQEFGENRRSAFVPAGQLSVEVVTQTLEQMQMIASREFNKQEIDRVYGTEMLFRGDISGDSRLAAEIQFARNTVQPLLDYVCDELSLKIAPFYGEDIVIASPDIVPQDKALAVQEYTIYGQDRSINENRAEQDKEEWKAPSGLEWAGAWPVRLFGLIEKSIIVPPGAGPEIESGGATEEPPEVGSLLGAPAPEQVAELEAGKAAMALAMDSDLKRWQKVARKEVRAGRDPSIRAFQSEVIPDDVTESIGAALVGASNDAEVKAAFAVPFGLGLRPSNVPWLLSASTAGA